MHSRHIGLFDKSSAQTTVDGTAYNVYVHMTAIFEHSKPATVDCQGIQFDSLLSQAYPKHSSRHLILYVSAATWHREQDTLHRRGH